MIIVFYDGACSLCRRFKARYENRLSPLVVEWVDVTQYPERLMALGYSLEEGLKSLHALDEAGKMHVGAPAIVLILKQQSSSRFWVGVLSWPIIKNLAQFCYSCIAHFRTRDKR